MKSIIIKYSKYILTLLAVAAMAVGLLMPAQIKAADSYNKDKKGSITINLDDVKQETALPIRPAFLLAFIRLHLSVMME